MVEEFGELHVDLRITDIVALIIVVHAEDLQYSRLSRRAGKFP